jgi:hypothetical protein
MTPPKQVRHPTDCRFTSGCSPPRLAATQLPSISGRTTGPGTDLHRADKASSRTHSWPGLARPVEEWDIVVPDVYPAYLSCDQYLRHRQQLHDNMYNFAKKARGAPRDGMALCKV